MRRSKKDGAGEDERGGAEAPRVEASSWADDGKLVRRRFGGPPGVQEPLRVDMEPRALADVVAHACETLDQEICGVLAGEPCEDAEGPFVRVVAAVRAPATRQGRAHVTFTQETWDAVHAAMEAQHPSLRIVGWYHSHPGFGVEFSEMDAFIQQNFFPQPTQVALVFDPLSGALGACIGAADGISRIGRIWVAGRERRCDTGAPAGGQAGASSAEFAALESRVVQVVEALDDARASLRRFLAVVAVAVGTVLALYAGAWVHRVIWPRPPAASLVQAAPLMVQVDGRSILIDLGVVLECEEMKPPATRARPQPGEPAPSPASSTAAAP